VAEYDVLLSVGLFIAGALIGIALGIGLEKKIQKRHIETQNVVKQQADRIIAKIDEKDVSSQFAEIIEVHEGIINDLENLGKTAKDGSFLILKGKSSAFDVTLMSSETLDIEGDFTFDVSSDMITLVRIDNKWKEVSRCGEL